ncbi:MAG: radical SAM family heme chaperone HemW [Erysipelotrichaceae bacterium]|nr:radical SAM family heme chaperone HemW [Erysipelotrichaceae bacterium]
MTSCYVHIPFCQSICSYCDFFRIKDNGPMRKQWLEVIQKEIAAASVGRVDTLYFGGGTPSLLTGEEFNQLAGAFSLHPDAEFTVECNPESVDMQKLQTYRKAGVNRISLGVQTMDDALLKRIGRNHTSRQALQAMDRIRQAGLDNLSVDLIFALPDQSFRQVRHDVETVLAAKIPHLSIYSLQIEENSVFGKQKLEPIDPQKEEEMYEWIVRRMKEAGYQHYEISSFALPGYESKHNLVYWSDADFYGFGPGASGRLHTDRYDHTGTVSSYIKDGPQIRWIEETVSEKGFNAIMMGLRTQYGVDIRAWNQKYRTDCLEKYKEVIRKYDQLYVRDHHLICTEEGRAILNTILVDFLEVD